MSRVRMLLLFVALGLCLPANADEPRLPFSAPVRAFGVPPEIDPATAAMMQDRAQSPQPTTPGGKLPQYRLGYRDRDRSNATDPNDGTLRLILALPDQPVLLEVTITIDGKPFRTARADRVKQLLEQANANPETAGADESAATTDSARVVRYRQSKGEPLTAEEVEWLLTNHVDGPALLYLKDNFQRFRADQRPVFDVLDRDRNGTLDADELKGAVGSLNECDRNRDGIVLYTEIAKSADELRRPRSDLTAAERLVGVSRMVFHLPHADSPESDYRRLALAYRRNDEGTAAKVPRFDTNANGRFDAEELQALRADEPDLRFTIAFNTMDRKQSRIVLTAAAASVADATAVKKTASGIELPVGGVTIAFSAIQSTPSDQISIGSVEDGYPILPVIDPNEDGRFTVREMRGIASRLKQFDRNRDGKVESSEATSTTRICFGLGPTVHRELSRLRLVKPSSGEPSVTGPEWFVRMDRNKDNDLVRAEFPGNDEQFTELDADRDGLVSAEEAIQFDRMSNGKSGLDKPPATAPAESTSTETDQSP